MTMHVVAPVVGHAAAGSGPHLNGIFLTPQPYMPPRLPTIGSTTGFSRSDPASKKLAAATSDANASPTSVVLERAPLTQRVAMATVCKTEQHLGAAVPGEVLRHSMRPASTARSTGLPTAAAGAVGRRPATRRGQPAP